MQYFLLMITFLVFFCQPNNNKDEQSLNTIESIASEKYQEHYEFEPNKNGRYTLCIRQEPETAEILFPNLRFFVFNNETNEIIFEDNLPNGSVKWITSDQIKVTIIPGIVQAGNEHKSGYIYDVKSGKKLK